ncbi:MAG: hypothetical protein ACYDD4_05315 [Acidimicrobiales bacterium]
MGIWLGAFIRRRWFSLIGFAVVFASLLLPLGSAVRLVFVVVGAALMLAQIPLSIRQERHGRTQGQQRP